MLTLLPLLLSAVMGQDPSGHEQEMPYVLHLMSQNETLYAFVDEREWDKARMTVYLDAPWLPPEECRRTLRKSDISDDYYQELRSEHQTRIEQGWKSRGFVLLTSDPKDIWVQEDQIDFAHRAAELERKVLETEELNSAASGSHLGELVVSNESSFLDLWGMHIAVLSIALAMSSTLAWFAWMR